MKDTPSKHDNFLADAIKPKTRERHIGYSDGFRFGFGFFIAGLFISAILAGLTWGIIALVQR